MREEAHHVWLHHSYKKATISRKFSMGRISNKNRGVVNIPARWAFHQSFVRWRAIRYARGVAEMQHHCRPMDEVPASTEGYFCGRVGHIDAACRQPTTLS